MKVGEIMDGLRFDLDWRITEFKNAMKESIAIQMAESEASLRDFKKHIVKKTIPIDVAIKLAVVIDSLETVIRFGEEVLSILKDSNEFKGYEQTCFSFYHEQLAYTLVKMLELNELVYSKFN